MVQSNLIRRAMVLGAFGLLLGACDEDGGRGSGSASVGGKGDCVGECAELGPVKEAICTAEVDGVDAPMQIEPDLIAKILRCDFENLGPQGLEAAAIAVRSTVYWQMRTEGEICTSDLFNCPNATCEGVPTEKYIEAARNTAGKYLAYNDQVTYGDYVSGVEYPEDHDAAKGCVLDNDDPRVTYNDGKSGDDVTQTIGRNTSKPSDSFYGQNRGAMSVHGMACLDEDGKTALDILKYFYGEDILVETAPVQEDCGDPKGFAARVKVEPGPRSKKQKDIKWDDYEVAVTESSESKDGSGEKLAEKGNEGEAGVTELEHDKTYAVWLRQDDEKWVKCDETFKNTDDDDDHVNVVVDVEINEDDTVDECKVSETQNGDFELDLTFRAKDGDPKPTWADYEVTVSTSSSDAGSGGAEKLTENSDNGVADFDKLDQAKDYYVWLRKGSGDWKKCGDKLEADDEEFDAVVEIDFGTDGAVDDCGLLEGTATFKLDVSVAKSRTSTDTMVADLDWSDYEIGVGTGATATDLVEKDVSDTGHRGSVELRGLEQAKEYTVWFRESGDWVKCDNRFKSGDGAMRGTLFTQFDKGEFKACSFGKDLKDGDRPPPDDPDPTDGDPTDGDPTDGDPTDGDPTDTDGGDTDGGDTDGGDTDTDGRPDTDGDPGDTDGGDENDTDDVFDDDPEPDYGDSDYDDPWDDDGDSDDGGWPDDGDDDRSPSPWDEDYSDEGDTDTDTDGGAAGEGGGCACSTNGDSAPGWLALIPLGLIFRRRRRAI